jgi:hypothetical protein
MNVPRPKRTLNIQISRQLRLWCLCLFKSGEDKEGSLTSFSDQVLGLLPNFALGSDLLPQHIPDRDLQTQGIRHEHQYPLSSLLLIPAHVHRLSSALPSQRIDKLETHQADPLEILQHPLTQRALPTPRLPKQDHSQTGLGVALGLGGPGEGREMAVGLGRRRGWCEERPTSEGRERGRW